MSSQASTTSSQHKKILRTKLKVWGRFRLRPDETFNVDKAEELIRKAVDNKRPVQTVLIAYGDGVRIGEKGSLTAQQIEFITYPSITAFISLKETPTMLALCNRNNSDSCVTVMQFKDLSALEAVCNVIDRQRSIMTTGRNTLGSNPVSSLNRSEVTTRSTPTVLVTTAAEVEQQQQQPQQQQASTSQQRSQEAITVTTVTTTETTNNVEDVAVVVTSNSSGGNDHVEGEGGSSSLFERRPFAAEITQPPEQQAQVTAVVHATSSQSTSANKNYDDDDDDDNHFRTSIVFGDESTLEKAERQQRMEALLQQRSHNGPSKAASSPPPLQRKSTIDAVILNYDELDVEGTHAVFDTPDGPPTQLNESANNLRFHRRPDSLQVTASSPSTNNRNSSGGSGSNRVVVTSFSSGRSDSPTENRVLLRDSPGSSEPTYRTSTVIYRDGLDSPSGERPRISYVANQQSQRTTLLGSPSSPQAVAGQPMQLVRLVPVGSARRRVVQPQPAQYYTIQQVSK